jgi:hypothetical protein
MIDATVQESAEAHAAQFTTRSGAVYEAFQLARSVVFDEVHSRIRWDLLEANMALSYQIICDSFSELDPVPIIAYMTDLEMAKVARLAERLPRGGLLTEEILENEGLGFVDIIPVLRERGGNPDMLYYVSAKDTLK